MMFQKGQTLYRAKRSVPPTDRPGDTVILEMSEFRIAIVEVTEEDAIQGFAKGDSLGNKVTRRYRLGPTLPTVVPLAVASLESSLESFLEGRAHFKTAEQLRDEGYAASPEEALTLYERKIHEKIKETETLLENLRKQIGETDLWRAAVAANPPKVKESSSKRTCGKTCSCSQCDLCP